MRERPANPAYSISARRWSPPPVRSVTLARAPGSARSIRVFTSSVEGIQTKDSEGNVPARLDPEHRHESLLVLGVDPGDDLDLLLDAGAAQLRREQLVHLEDPGRVVHVDLDAHGLLLAPLHFHDLDRRSRE